MIFATWFSLRRLVGCPRRRLQRGSGSGFRRRLPAIASARQGQVSAAKQGRPGGSYLDDHEAFIIGMIEASKDITLNEMVLRLEEDRSVSIGRSTLDLWLRKRGFTFKKDRTCIGAGAARSPEAASGLVRCTA